MKIIFLLLLLAFTSAFARDWSVLQKVEWERDTTQSGTIQLRFTLKDPPNYYPVFFEEDPPAMRIVFSGTRLDSNMTEVRTVPPPLTGFSVTEKRLAKGDPVTQIAIGLEKKCPFTTKLEKDVITLSIDVSSLIRGNKIIVDKKESAEGVNRVRNISVQETSNNVEIMLTLASPAMGFSAYTLDSTPRLVVDLPGVLADSAAARAVDIAPVCTLMTIAKENFTRLVFSLKKKVDVKTMQKGNRLSLLLPREKSMMERNKKWVYLSASALLLGGVGGAVMLMGGDEGAKPATDETPAGDNWRTKPPHPSEIP
ncbi:MAG: AMIN domain-containing protein [Fibrobacterota bacterium]